MPATLLKSDSNTGAFLWILGNFQEHLFLQNTFGGCFWTLLDKPEFSVRIFMINNDYYVDLFSPFISSFLKVSVNLSMFSSVLKLADVTLVYKKDLRYHKTIRRLNLWNRWENVSKMLFKSFFLNTKLVSKKALIQRTVCCDDKKIQKVFKSSGWIRCVTYGSVKSIYLPTIWSDNWKSTRLRFEYAT